MKMNMKRFFKKSAATIICTAASCILLTGITAFSQTVSVTWGSLALNSNGSASWRLQSAPDNLVVDKYELKLARKSNGKWNESYKTVKTSDEDYDFSFSSTGQYYYAVRAMFVGGDNSNWSMPSPTVSVSSEDVNKDYDHPDNARQAYVPMQASNGTIYYIPAGPGLPVNNNTVISGGPGNSNAVISNNPNQAITGNNASSGWIHEGNKWRYKYANNTYASNSWDYINNKWYYFDNTGYMVTGWVFYNNNWYLCDTSGARQTGWNLVNNKWYYMNEGGIMQTGYINVNGITYYTDQSGARFENGYNPDGHYFDQSGVMIK